MLREIICNWNICGTEVFSGLYSSFLPDTTQELQIQLFAKNLIYAYPSFKAVNRSHVYK